MVQGMFCFDSTTRTSPGPGPSSHTFLSTPEQFLGDFEHRQLDDAKSYAKKKGLPFNEILKIADRDLSDDHRDHAKKAALGRFLKRVEAGEIPEGSIADRRS